MNDNVTLESYRDAVVVLLSLARGDTGGGVVAAQVLLSLYNGYDFHVDLTDLGRLDHDHLDAACLAIACRHKLFTEPHEVIPDGSAKFEVLRELYPNLNVRRRYEEFYK